MNWNAVGAIGALISATAVVASVIYLAIQIRQNSKIVAANTFQSISATSADLAIRMAESPELSELLTKAFSGYTNWTPREAMQLQLFLRGSFRNYENYYYQHRLGNFEEELWVGYEQAILDLVSRGFGEAWWSVHQVAFGRSFAEFVNVRLASRLVTGSPWEMGKAPKGEGDA
jgi:hypothetical protein